nr:hypothetical protein Iba_chr02cCG12340 [Ipomoea batatas]
MVAERYRYLKLMCNVQENASEARLQWRLAAMNCWARNRKETGTTPPVASAFFPPGGRKTWDFGGRSAAAPVISSSKLDRPWAWGRLEELQRENIASKAGSVSRAWGSLALLAKHSAEITDRSRRTSVERNYVGAYPSSPDLRLGLQLAPARSATPTSGLHADGRDRRGPSRGTAPKSSSFAARERGRAEKQRDHPLQAPLPAQRFRHREQRGPRSPPSASESAAIEVAKRGCLQVTVAGSRSKNQWMNEVG